MLVFRTELHVRHFVAYQQVTGTLGTLHHDGIVLATQELLQLVNDLVLPLFGLDAELARVVLEANLDLHKEGLPSFSR